MQVVGCGLQVVGCGLWLVGCGLWVVGGHEGNTTIQQTPYYRVLESGFGPIPGYQVPRDFISSNSNLAEFKFKHFLRLVYFNKIIKSI